MKALIIGYGSIGKRHADILVGELNLRVDLVTKQDISAHVCYSSLEGVKDIQEYDYILIASETYKHYEQLKYLENRVSGKKLFIEKPLFDTIDKHLDVTKNDVYVGYNLRFHPVIEKVKELISGSKTLSVNIHVGQYLPNWRRGTDYRCCYSADLEKGGGVLRDLSHELDYIQWLFGSAIEFKGYNRKISDLEINSDDIVTGVALTDRDVFVNFTLDYISKKAIRNCIIHLSESTLICDLMSHTVEIVEINGENKNIEFETIKDSTYINMHKSILNENQTVACTYQEGINVMKFLNLVQQEGGFIV